VLGLKRVAMLDVVLLACFYTGRILAGGAAADIRISAWLLAFSGFFFVSLALSKRYAEIASRGGVAPGRPYQNEDLPVLIKIGVASANAAIVVFALYAESSDTLLLYHRPSLLLLICPVLLYWLNRVWLLTYHRAMKEDAILFAFADRASYLAGILSVGIVLCAI